MLTLLLEYVPHGLLKSLKLLFRISGLGGRVMGVIGQLSHAINS